MRTDQEIQTLHHVWCASVTSGYRSIEGCRAWADQLVLAEAEPAHWMIDLSMAEDQRGISIWADVNNDPADIWPRRYIKPFHYLLIGYFSRKYLEVDSPDYVALSRDIRVFMGDWVQGSVTALKPIYRRFKRDEDLVAFQEGTFAFLEPYIVMSHRYDYLLDLDYWKTT